MTAIRFGLIGCGKITQRLALPQLTSCPSTVVTALVDTDRALAESVAAQAGLNTARIWTDWRRMLSEAEVDAVGVCLPNHLHAEVTLAALEAKKHVMVEKPMALTLAEADAMIAAAKSHRRLLMVEQTQRFEPAHELAHEMLRSGMLGRIVQCHGRLAHAGPEYWSSTSAWFTQRGKAGGGALVDVGVHIADLLRWLTGKPVARVCAAAKTLEKPVEVEDTASVMMEWADGTLGTFEASWTGRPYEVTTRVATERGVLRTSLGSAQPLTIHWCKPDDPGSPLGEPFAPAVPAASRWGGAYPYFARCIQEHLTPFVSGEEGRASLEIILAAYESIRQGGWITLPLKTRGQSTVHSRQSIAKRGAKG